MRKLFSGILIIACTLFLNCRTTSENKIVASGIIQEQGITSYQYGTHIMHGDVLYALKSDTIILDQFLGKNIKVEGYEMDGYPIDNGPKYINVIKIIE